MKILLAGASGFIGTSLIRKLTDSGHKLVLLTRDLEKSARRTHQAIDLVYWDGKNVGAWCKHVQDADAIINLSGEGIAEKRWTRDQKKLIVSSRVESTRAIVQAISKSERKPGTLINASAVGFYGNVADSDVSETTPKGSGFLADTCDLWEKEANAAQKFGFRVVLTRIGVVLDKDGGALQKMIPPFQFYAGGPLGSGTQWFPWIHRDDVVGILQFCVENPAISGPVNVTAPAPLQMKTFCAELGKVLGKPSWAPVPSFALRLLLGEMADMLLGGQKALPKKMQQAGYSFKYPILHQALKAILKPS